MVSRQPKKTNSTVTDARAAAQRVKLDAQADARKQQEEAQQKTVAKKPKGKREQQRLLNNRRANTTIERAIEDYLLDHEGATIARKRWNGTILLSD